MTVLISGPAYLLFLIAIRPLNKRHRVPWKGTFTDKAVFFWIKKKKRLPWQPGMNSAHHLHIKFICKGYLESWGFASFLLGIPENYTKVLQIRIAQEMDGTFASTRSKTAQRYNYLCKRKEMYFSHHKFSNGCTDWKIWCMKGRCKAWEFPVRRRDLPESLPFC